MRRLSVHRGDMSKTHQLPTAQWGRACAGKSLVLLKRTVIKRILGRHLRQNFNHQKLNQGLNATVLLRGCPSLRISPERGPAVEAVEGERKKENFNLSLSLLLLLSARGASCHLTFPRRGHTQFGPADIRHWLRKPLPAPARTPPS